MDTDFAAAFMSVVVILLAIYGIGSAAYYSGSFNLPKNQWHCTATTIIDGKAECIRYERKEK